MLPCKHTFCYLCLKTSYQRISSCPLCRGKIPPNVFDRAVLNQEDPVPVGESWLYSGRNGGWWSYDTVLSSEIEQAYKKSNSIHNFSVLGNEYTIDFGTMIQIQLKTGARRKVKRVDTFDTGLVKGIAGLRLGQPGNSTSSSLPSQSSQSNRTSQPVSSDDESEESSDTSEESSDTSEESSDTSDSE